MMKKRFVSILLVFGYLLSNAVVFSQDNEEKIYSYTMYENTFDEGKDSIEAIENEFLSYSGMEAMDKASGLQTVYSGDNTGIRIEKDAWCWDKTFFLDFTKGDVQEGIKSGTVTVSFDYSMDEESTADHAIIGMNMKNSYDGQRLMYIKKGSYCVMDTVGAWPGTYTSGVSCDEIHNLKIVIDFDENTATYYLDNENIKVQSITGIVMNNLAISLSGIINYFDNLKVTAEYKNPVEIIAATNNFGNNFFENENIKFKIEAKNRADEAISETADIKVENSAGEIVFEKTQVLDLESKGYMSMDLTLDLKEFDSYIMTINSANSIGFTTRFARSVKATENNPVINTNGHLDGRFAGADVPNLFFMMDNAGYGAIRTQYPFKKNSDGTFFVHEDQSWYSQTLESSQKYGIDLVALLPSGVGTKDADGGFNTDDAALSEYSSWCEWMANRYKGKISWFELGNEDNYVKKSDGTPDSGADYYKILKAGYDGIKNGNKEALVITSGSQVLYTDEEKNQRQFAEGMLGAMKENNDYCFDVYGVHPYHVAESPEVQDSHSENTTWLEQCEVLNGLFNTYGVSGKQKWATEMGYHTTIDDEKQQAARLVRMFALNEIFSYHEKMFNFCIMDPGLDKSYSEHNYGMLCYYADRDWHDRSAYSAKAPYIATAQWNKLLSGADFKAYETTRSSTGLFRYTYTYTAHFEKGDKKITVVWNPDNYAKDIKLTETGKNAVVYDMYGNVVNTSVDEVTVTTSENPVYVVFSNKDKILYENKFDSGVEDYVSVNNNYMNVKFDKVYKMAATDEGGIALAEDKPSDRQTMLFDFTCGGKKAGFTEGVYKISYEVLVNTQSGQQTFTGINMNNHYEGGRALYFSKSGYMVMPTLGAWAGQYVFSDELIKVDMIINIDENKVDYYINDEYYKTQTNLANYKPVKNFSIALGGAIKHFDNIRISRVEAPVLPIEATVSISGTTIRADVMNNKNETISPVLFIAQEDGSGRLLNVHAEKLGNMNLGDKRNIEYTVTEKQGKIKTIFVADIGTIMPICDKVTE